MSHWLHRPLQLRLLALLLAAAIVLALQWLAPQALGGAEERAGDLTWRASASGRAERRLVVVDIDEASLREVGAWPWPRATIAQLSQRLQQAGAVVQAFDITFSDPREDDALLAQAWAAAPVVAAQIFSIDATVTPKAGALGAPVSERGCPAFAPVSHGYYGNTAELLRAAPVAGHITPRIEGDGVVRKVPGLICHEGRAYPSLALAAFWRAAQPEAGAPLGPPPAPDWQWHLRSQQGLAGSPLGPAAWLSSRSLPGLVVPLDERGDLRVPYGLERRAFASVSAADVLRGSADVSLLKGTVALIGATAFGIGDTVATPHSAIGSGIEVHAQLLAGLLDHRLPYTPERAALLQWGMAALVAGLLFALVLRRRAVPAKRLPLAGLALAALCWLGASLGLAQGNLWLPWAAPALFAVLLSVSLATAEHALTRAQRERLSAHLGAYLPAPVAQRLMASEPSGTLQVDQRDISVLSADIRNFSAFAAYRPPQETAAMLHAFCCIAVEVVEQHHGVVENVVGDSVLAVWNAYSDCPDHAKQAMAAAQELLRATRQLLASSHPTSELGAVQPLALGVGLESGMAIVGSFGPARRRAHAALGEPVSVATRIQKMTLDLSIPILAGPQLAARLTQGSTEALGDYLLEGSSKHYALYAPSSWAELVPTDPQWASGATTESREPSTWSRWSDERGKAVLSKAVSATLLRDA